MPFAKPMVRRGAVEVATAIAPQLATNERQRLLDRARATVGSNSFFSRFSLLESLVLLASLEPSPRSSLEALEAEILRVPANELTPHQDRDHLYVVMARAWFRLDMMVGPAALPTRRPRGKLESNSTQSRTRKAGPMGNGTLSVERAARKDRPAVSIRGGACSPTLAPVRTDGQEGTGSDIEAETTGATVVRARGNRTAGESPHRPQKANPKKNGPTVSQTRGLRWQLQNKTAQSRMRKVGPMRNVRFIGLDVHKDSIVIAVAESDGSQPEVVCTIPNETRLLLKQMKKLEASGSLRVCYEAGPTGFGLYRALREVKIDCQVVAPSLIPKKPGDRVKTDKRDAKNLARFLRSGDLTPIHVPDAATEAMRDLERAREDAKEAERTARHQLTKFLLRHSKRFDGKTAWTAAHLDWIRSQKFEHEAQNRVLVDYVHAVESATARVAQLTKDIVDLVEIWSLKPLVQALQALRGIQVLSAVVLAAEIGDFSRFASASEFMAYLGLIPSEYTTGDSERRGGITRAGNGHARRILIESAWTYRYRANMSSEIRKRNQGVSEAVRQIAWKAQCRLHSRYQRMTARGKVHQVVVTAVARELAGFVWSVARQPELLAR